MVRDGPNSSELFMDLALRQAIVSAINSDKQSPSVVSAINMAVDGSGTIVYNPQSLWVDPNAPGFSGTTASITDEELVRAYLLTKLVSQYGYPASQKTIEVERVYKPVGRPIGKGGRVDILVRKSIAKKQGDAFLFIECKAPSKFDEDIKFIDGQLFRLSKQEPVRPRFLVYYTVENKGDDLRDRVILIDTEAFPDYDAWDQAGQPITDNLPSKYGAAIKKRFANVLDETDRLRPLDRETTPETFNRLQTEIHDVIWGGGGTNNNEVFR
jgi:type I restriction enzyme M protein